jgi:carbonic anhydrase/acetyltransferase-like protein (isoleucine patch superfamily)
MTTISLAAEVHQMAHVHPQAQVYAGAKVAAFACIGKGCIIGHGVEIGEGAQVGDGVWVYSRASIGKGCIVGANQRIREGWIIPDGGEVPGRERSAYFQLELPPMPELNTETLKVSLRNMEDAMAHHILMGYDLAALEMRAAQFAARSPKPAVPQWGGIVDPAKNPHLNPDYKPNTKRFAKTWNPGRSGYLKP